VQWETEREAGNDAYSLHRWDTAILHYTRAIDANPVEAVLWTNRAAAYNAKGWYHQALHDAERAVALRGAEWYKPWARKAAACLGLKQYREAEAAYSTSIRLAQEHEEEQSVLEVLQQGLVNAKRRGGKEQTNPLSSTARKGSGTSDGACSTSNLSPSSLAQEVAELRSRVAKLEMQVETFKSLLPVSTSELHCQDKVNHSSSEKGDSTENGKEDSPGVVGDGDTEESTESSVCTVAVEVGDQLSDESDTDGSGTEDEFEFEDDRMMKQWMDQVKAARAALLGSSLDNSFVLVPPPPSTRRMTAATAANEKDGIWRRQPKPPPTTTTSTEAIATSSSSSQSSQSSKPSPRLRRGNVLDVNRLMDILQSDSVRDTERGDEESRPGDRSAEEGLASAPVDLQSTAQEIKKPSIAIPPEEKDRLDRIQATMLRQQEAEEAGEVLQSTNLDALTQAKRGMCQNCARRPESEEKCKGFCVLYRTIDATNPEVMLFCSLCGCPADAHPIDEAWQAEERERLAKEAAFNTNRRRTSHQFHSDHMISGRQLEEERKALAVLGLPPGSDSKSISKAYKRLALLMHPDKRNKTASDQRIEPQVYDDNDDRFVKVTQAYKLLMSRCR